MENKEMILLEKEMATFDLFELNTTVESSKTSIAKATTALEVTDAICAVWKKIGKFIKPLASLPVFGKYIKAISDLLDSLCG